MPLSEKELNTLIKKVEPVYPILGKLLFNVV